MSDEPWTIGKVLSWAKEDLAKRSSTSPRLDAELLLALVLGCDRVKLVIDSQRPLAPEELAAYKALHVRRRRGEPIAYIRGEREFHSRPFRVDRRVLVPRPETELLVETGLRRTRHLSLCARVLDLCTGSGCVAITLERERPTTSVLGSDISADALAVARDNAHRLGARVGFVQSDLFEAFGTGHRFDLITANPPYIPVGEMPELPVDVRQFEPSVALAAGSDGLSVIRPLIGQAPAHLDPDGVLAIEIVAGSAADVASMMRERGYRDIEIERDYGGHERIISARSPA
ncbi:MAG TPA: peptide chain release factor N(5)-glutamine methyltransferase [Polyangiaceae bacterium]|nr:peptide chain release factor N(5)-glutamine methyltransferase [Polyangiaceae bacterium]